MSGMAYRRQRGGERREDQHEKLSELAVCRQNLSLYFFAMDFGSISPTKNTTAVVTKVPAVTADMPHLRISRAPSRWPRRLCVRYLCR